MKNNILKISILPLLFLMAISFSSLPPQKEKGNNKENNSKGNGNGDSRGQENNKEKGNSDRVSKGNQNDHAERADNGQQRGNDNHGKSKSDQNEHNYQKDKNRDDHKGNNDARGNSSNKDKSASKDDKENGNDKGHGNGKSRKESIKWDQDDSVVWGFENGSSRKRPGDHKKVTVCHNTGDSDYPVSISVSENALKAHLNHGDQAGNCTTNYSDRWPANFIKSRENVYNTYENTWETMSYSEALVRFAAQKLLGIKSTFQAQRPTMTSQEIQRRETLIMELQNNVNSLQNQLSVAKQRTEGINININL